MTHEQPNMMDNELPQIVSRLSCLKHRAGEPRRGSVWFGPRLTTVGYGSAGGVTVHRPGSGSFFGGKTARRRATLPPKNVPDPLGCSRSGGHPVNGCAVGKSS